MLLVVELVYVSWLTGGWKYETVIYVIHSSDHLTMMCTFWY